MSGLSSIRSTYRFGIFELDVGRGELLKNGRPVKLQPQPFKVLALVVARAGEAVGRDEIQHHVWGDSFVDFDKGLAYCVRQVRLVLGDDAVSPRYLETVPRRGFRFIAPVEQVSVDTAKSQTVVVNPELEFRDAAPPTAEPAPLHTTVSFERRKAARWTLAAVAAVLVLTAAGLSPRPEPGSARVLRFQERDWVLISAFENRTGESLFDGTLEYALERELGTSRFVNVVPGERVSDTLALMKKPAGTVVDAALGREICLRDGGIRALLTGRVESLASRYRLTVNVLDPVHSVIVASIEEEARSLDDVWPATRRLSDQVRQRLGEGLAEIRQDSERLARVTTPSLRALQYYSRGLALTYTGGLGNWRQSAELLRRAVEEDPDFASAHIMLAHACLNLDRRPKVSDEADPCASSFRRALELAYRTSDRERYFILGSYYWRFEGDDRKAEEAFQILVRLYPDDYWGLHKLVMILQKNRPDDPQLDGFLERLAEMLPQSAWAEAWAVRRYLPLWLQGDGTKLLSHAEKSRAWGAHLTLGGLAAAREALSGLVPGARPMLCASLGRIALAREDWDALRLQAKECLSEERPFDMTTRRIEIILAIRAGLLEDAEREIARFRGWWRLDSGRPPGDAYLLSLDAQFRGELALARGESGSATRYLRQVVTGVRSNQALHQQYFNAVESLASALVAEGKLAEAEELLVEASKRTSFTSLDHGYWWLRCRWRLAQLYRKTKRNQEAQAVEAQLRKLLAFADADHPILVDIGRHATRTTQATRQ